MLENVVYGVITKKGETLFEFYEDGYYILYYIILYFVILYIYTILYYIYILYNYKTIITGNSFSSNYIEYESNHALFVEEYLNHI